MVTVKFENLNIMNLYKIFRYQGKLYRRVIENNYNSHNCIIFISRNYFRNLVERPTVWSIMNLYKIFRYQGKLYREYSENQYKSHCSSCIISKIGCVVVVIY